MTHVSNIEPQLISRPFASETDWWKVRNLLIETFSMTGPGLNWEIRHWEGNRFHRGGAGWQPEEYADMRLWETDPSPTSYAFRDIREGPGAGGRLVGVAHHEGEDLWLEVHPDYRSQIEEDMLAWAEAHYAQVNDQGQRQAHVTIYEYDAPRWKLLQSRGYEKMPYGWITRWMRLGSQPLREPVLADGYTLRATCPESAGDEHWADCRRLADLLNRAFERPDFHQAEEVHNFMTRAPVFLNDLCLVMVAPDGTFAAHAALNYDAANRYAIFEPVCTHPDHRQKGLAKALMLELLIRIKPMGAKIIEVSTGDADAANALYDSLGFTEYYKAYAWKKVW
jgi:mycothiol synthase